MILEFLYTELREIYISRHQSQLSTQGTNSPKKKKYTAFGAVR